MTHEFFRRRVLPHDLRWEGDGFSIDVPGPYRLEWRVKHARDRVRHVKEHPIPVVTGVAFVAAPYVVGASFVAFGPPPLKAVGVAMLVPNPIADVAYFAAGYAVGESIEDMFM